MKLADVLQHRWQVNHQVVLEAGTAGDWARYAVFTPHTLRMDNGYRLYYTGIDADWKWGIGTASSTDLLHWEKHPQPILPSGAVWDKDIDFPYPIEVGGKYYVFYEAKRHSVVFPVDPEFGRWPGMTVAHMYSRSTGMAVSADGIHFSKEPEPVFTADPHGSWDHDGICASRVYRYGDGFCMYYAGSDRRLVRTGLAFSDDLHHWQRYAQNPIIDVGAAGSWDSATVLFGSVIELEDGYLGAYEGEDGQWMRIGLATSTDMIYWTKYAGNPIVSAEHPYTTHDAFVCAPHLVLHDGALYLLYTYNAPIDGKQARIEIAKLEM